MLPERRDLRKERASATRENSGDPVIFALACWVPGSVKRDVVGLTNSRFMFFLMLESKTVTFLDLFPEPKE
jgi:hypothetical protein